MDIGIIINSILLIFILHIILLNVNASYSKPEKFSNADNKSIDFLTSDSSENDVFKKKLLKYIQQDNIDVKGDDELSNTFVKKNVLEIHPSNSYLNSNNVPNFESNVIDTSKFYNVQQYDNLNENDLKKTSKNLLKNMDIDIQKQNSIQGEGRGGAVRVSTEFPDNWTYKNELPMNGGEMSGIYGFDELESQFAVFDKTRIGPTGNEFNNIAQNDLRKPIVYN